MTIVQFVEIFFISLANAVGQVLLKKANLKTFGWEMLSNKFVWAGALIYVAAFWFWVKVINQTEMSVAVPIFTSIIYVFTLIFALYFFSILKRNPIFCNFRSSNSKNSSGHLFITIDDLVTAANAKKSMLSIGSSVK